MTLADIGVATAPSPKAALTKGVSYLCSLVLKIFNRSRLLRTMFNSDHSSTLTRYLVSLSQKKNVHFCALSHPPGDNLPCWLTNTVHIYIYQSRSIFIVCSWINWLWLTNLRYSPGTIIFLTGPQTEANLKNHCSRSAFLKGKISIITYE